MRWRMLVDAPARQFRRVVRQVPDDELVLVGRVRRQRPHHRQAAALGARTCPRRAGRAGPATAPPISSSTASLRRSFRQKSHSRGWRCLISRASAMVARTSDSASCAPSCTRPLARVRCSSLNEARPSSCARPFDAVGAQRAGAAHHVEQVPAAAVVLPLARVGVDQVAPEQEARDLVVEADRVVAHAHRAGPRQLRLDGGGEGMFGHALLQAVLRRDAGQQAGLGLGQEVRRRPAVQHHRRVDLVQLGIGAHAGELRRPVAARHGAEGLVVVPEEASARSCTQDNRCMHGRRARSPVA